MDMLPPSGVRPRCWLSQSGVNLPKKQKVALVTTPTGKNNSDDFRRVEALHLSQKLSLIFKKSSAPHRLCRWGAFFYFQIILISPQK